MLKYIASFIFLAFSISAHAMFCPTNFNQITIGDTIEHVQQQCGKPDIEKKSTSEVDTGPQEWNYYVSPGFVGYNPPPVAGQQQGSVQMTLALNNNKILNITVNGMSLASTTLCGNSVSVGDSAERVKSACGDPVFVNKSSNQPKGKPTTIETTTLKNNSTPPVTLIFENDKLKGKE